MSVFLIKIAFNPNNQVKEGDQMIKVCEICDNEFETVYTNKKYCSEECSREAIREADRLRKSKKREVIRKKQTAEEAERRRLKKAEIEKRTEEIAREKKADLQRRLKEGEPKAVMEVTNHYDIEYWEACKEVFEQDYYNRNNTEIINDIDIRTKNAPGQIVESIKELGRINTRLVRLK